MGKFGVNLCRYTRDSLKKLAQVASATRYFRDIQIEHYGDYSTKNRKIMD